MNKWEEGYTLKECRKQMTSKESTELAIRELIEYHVKAALETLVEKQGFHDGANKEFILSAYDLKNIV